MIIKSSKDEFENYLSDAANFRGTCESVLIPENEDDVVDILKDANRNKTRITVSGNGTGLTGGRVPQQGNLISTERLNKILLIDETNLTAIVEPGVILADFQKLLTEKKLYYPPDPTETNCFIGGTIANNSSGAKSFKYGATRNFVNGLKIILPDGEKLSIKRGEYFSQNFILKLKTESGKEINVELPQYKMPEVKNAAGYFTGNSIDAIDLFVGSEGTLGIVTEVELKLLNAPTNILSAVIFFDSEINALHFIDKARRLSKKNDDADKLINALGLEFFDAKSLDFLRGDYPAIPNCSAAVWFEQELEADNNLVIDAWVDLITEFEGDLDNSWMAADNKDRMKFKDFRHAVSYKVSEYVSSKAILKVGTDTAVPSDKFEDYYFWSKKMVNDFSIPFIVYGHFGDSHMHLNMLPENETEYATAKKIYYELCKRAVELGGTVSAEHGIGKLKRDYLLMMYGERNIKAMAAVKKTLDPNLILNIGNIFEERFLLD